MSRISYNQPGSTSPVRVECSDGSAYDADHVICTMSLGVLKERHVSIFNPLLPLEKITTIEGIYFGTVAKIYLEFDEPFWPDDWKCCSLLWNYEELKSVREHKHSWLEGAVGFYTVDRHPNLISTWICGDNSKRLEQTPKDEVKASALWLMRMFLKDFNIPDPINVIT